MKSFNWLNIEEIVFKLYDLYPETDPLTVRFTDLTSWVRSLEGFEEEKGPKVNEKILETIQMRWLEEYRMDHQDV